jgi:hypothetical protein
VRRLVEQEDYALRVMRDAGLPSPAPYGFVELTPDREYRRALRQFSVEEISEGFAAARGLALPSQLRRMLRAQGRDLHAEFTQLLPAPPQPIRVQRWSARRIGLWAAILLLLGVVAANRTPLLGYERAVQTPLGAHALGCGDLESLWLEAQSVPSASLVPCIRSPLAGWTVTEVAINDGRSVVKINHDRAGPSAVVLRLTAACDPAGAVQAPSPAPGVRRYQRAGPRTGEFRATWYDLFPGGCLTYQLHSTSDVKGRSPRSCPRCSGSRPATRSARRCVSAPTGDSGWTPLPPVIRSPQATRGSSRQNGSPRCASNPVGLEPGSLHEHRPLIILPGGRIRS